MSPKLTMYDLCASAWGYDEFDEYDEEDERPAQPEVVVRQHQEPEPMSTCDHLKVYAAQNEGPYPWICASCLDTGSDTNYPVCSSQLFSELLVKKDPANQPTGQAKLRACYYCGRHVHGIFDDLEPVRCGKCF